MKENKEKITGLKDLHAEIQRLESRKVALESGIRDDFQVIVEDLKPSTIIKNTLRGLRGSPDFSKGILRLAMALGAGYVSKKLITGKSAGMLGKVMGTAIQFGVMALAGKGSGTEDTSTPTGSGVRFKKILKKLFSA